MGKRGPQPKGNVKIEWSPDFAYAIGLIVTDGCLYNDGRHMSLVSKDIEMIEDFKNILGLTNKIGMKLNGAGGRTPHIQFGDTLFYALLQNIGLSSKKSKTIGEIKIPDEYFFDFLRGCFDGDGCTYSYWDKRWKSSFMFYTYFCSGSLKHVQWLQRKIFKRLGIKGHMDMGKSREYYQLKYAKADSLILWKAMYYKGATSYLKRKKLKIDVTLCIMDEHSREMLTK